MISLTRKARAFARQLAESSPLLEREARKIAAKIRYSEDIANQIIAGEVCAWEPRESFYHRLRSRLA